MHHVWVHLFVKFSTKHFADTGVNKHFGLRLQVVNIIIIELKLGIDILVIKSEISWESREAGNQQGTKTEKLLQDLLSEKEGGEVDR